MILLIAGGTHTGKTLLAQRLLEKHGYPYLSIDHLKMGLIRSGYCALSPESPEAELTAYLWPVVREIIKTTIENRQSLIVEGSYIPFDWKADFSPAYRGHIRYVCLVFSREYIEGHYNDILRYESAIEERMTEGEDCLPREMLLEENARNLRLCREQGFECILIDGEYAVDVNL